MSTGTQLEKLRLIRKSTAKGDYRERLTEEKDAMQTFYHTRNISISKLDRVFKVCWKASPTEIAVLRHRKRQIEMDVAVEKRVKK